MDAPTIPIDFAARVDTYDDPVDLVSLLALRAFLGGDQPVARTRSLDRVRADAALVPNGFAATWTARGSSVWAHACEGPGWTLVAKVWTAGSAVVTVTARTDELAVEVLAAATDGAEAPEPQEATAVPVGFWHLADRGPRRVVRDLEAPTWDEIRCNYTATAATALDGLLARREGPESGRLILLHGPPGTGKTTLVRTLARAWRDWCQVHQVVDPERLLGVAGYLVDVLAEADDQDRWQLLVLEDCDELVRADAKVGSGQALARLLNLTDGLIGQGARVLVCITTNERVGALHPAVTRPGRCLAEVEVGALSAAEARAWLGRDLPAGTGEATLAQLCAWRAAGPAPVSDRPEPASGYL